jgi:hypothetical protein
MTGEAALDETLRVDPETATWLHAAADNAGLPCDGDHSRGWGYRQIMAERLPQAVAGRPPLADDVIRGRG